MKKRKLFSNSDGTTFLEDAADIKEDVKAFFNHLPLELKTLLPIAEDIVRALQNLDDMLEEGTPVNEAIEKVLAMTKSEVDDRVYTIIKHAVEVLSERFGKSLDVFGRDLFWGEAKHQTASDVLIGEQQVSKLQADTAIQLAVYAVKS